MFIPITLITLTALMVLNSNIHISCLPCIRDEFTTSSFIVQFAFTLNPIISIFTNFIFGSLSEFYNKKYLLIINLICFLFGSILCFFSTQINIFLLGRFFQAIGDGGIAVMGLAILSSITRKDFAYYLGISSAFFAVAWGGGPLLGTLILNLFGWKWNFLIIFLSVFIAAILLIIYLPATILKPVNNEPYNIKTVWSATLKLLNNRNFSAANWGTAIAIGTFGAFEVSSPFIFIDSYNFTPAQFSFFNAIIITINGIASIIYLKTARKFKVKTSLLIGSFSYVLYVCGAALILSRFGAPSPYIILLFIGALAFSLPFLTSTTTIYALQETKNNNGLALAILSCSRNIASSCTSLIVSSFYNGNIYPFFTVSFAFAVLALRFLFITSKISINS